MSMHSVDIKLENVCANEVLQYPVIFIRGIIRCKEVCNEGLLKGKISVLVASDLFEFNVLDGRFKCIIELKLGPNFLKITYDNNLHAGQTALTLVRRSNFCDNVLKLVYIIPNGDLGTFQCDGTGSNTAKNACEKIVTGVKLLQCLVAERLHEQGLGRKTYSIFSQNGKEVCEVFHSQHSKQEFFSCTSEEIWSMTARELLGKGIFVQGVKVLAFLSCTEYFKEFNETKGYVACGRGHLAMISSLGLHSWASSVNSVLSFLTSKVPIDSSLLDDSGFRGTLGGCYATSLGATLHEMGHVFDLVHSDRGIMARGFEDIDLFFTLENPQRNIIQKVKGKSNGPEICVRTRSPTKVTSVNFGFVSSGSDKEQNRDGQAYFHRSAAVLLSGHPWFNESHRLEDFGPVQISGLEVKAPNGLRLIELHAEDDRLVKYWDFTKNPNKIHRFCLSLFDVKDVVQPSVLIQDIAGKIAAFQLNLNAFQSS